MASTSQIEEASSRRCPHRDSGLEWFEYKHAVAIGGDTHMDPAEQRVAVQRAAKFVGRFGKPLFPYREV
ncbi:MAG: hypothetical protein F4X60_07740 [Gemmatimonadetes bacterium]|nr:hypothetical protein [Gemmatimonadota bacterium]